MRGRSGRWQGRREQQQEQPGAVIRTPQSGFTLIEIAIVLVIIGLLAAGISKGQELISNARVKSLIADLRKVQVYVYGYQDKYRALPGDQPQAMLDSQFGVGRASAAADASTLGNGVIDGAWNAGPGAETNVFWQHVRLARLAPGETAGTTDFRPRNTDGGLVGIQSGGAAPIANLNGTFIICSSQILGHFAKQIDTLLDDGVPGTGSVMVTATGGSADFSTAQAAVATVAEINDAAHYTVCRGL